jgi:hypothetical protein
VAIEDLARQLGAMEADRATPIGAMPHHGAGT